MKYTVIVNKYGTFWYKEGTNLRHREDGPAFEYVEGNKYWFLDDLEYSEKEFHKELAKRKNTCNNKIVEIDGKKYKLTLIEE